MMMIMMLMMIDDNDDDVGGSRYFCYNSQLQPVIQVALNTIRYFSVMYPSMTIGRKAVITTLVATLMMSCVVNAPFTFMYGVIMINLKDDYIILCEVKMLFFHFILKTVSK